MQSSQMAIALAITTALSTLPVHAVTYYVSPTGNDTLNDGKSLGATFGTIAQAVSVANPGDAILVRGGTYNLSSTLSIGSGKNGTAVLPYTLQAYDNETPVLNFAATAVGTRGFQLNGSYWNIKGITVRNAGDNGMHIQGSNNLVERCVFTGNKDSGLQISGSSSQKPANNLIKNCDSFANYDPQADGENADGFAAKFRDLGTGNQFVGCRAWGNSDDGWDFWAAANAVTVKDCWAFKNGFNTFSEPNWAGDGNGLKLGHDSGAHVLQNLLVWGNRLNGIDVNGNATVDSSVSSPYVAITHGTTLQNITAVNNGAGGNGSNFYFDEFVAGSPHKLQNNISFSQAGVGTSGTNGVNIFAGNVNDHNSWNGVGVSLADFLSLSDAIAMGPRAADGSLPFSNFLRLANASALVNAGINVGLPYNGAAPDIGAYEVPEPTTLLLAAPMAAGLLARRRTRPAGVWSEF